MAVPRAVIVTIVALAVLPSVVSGDEFEIGKVGVPFLDGKTGGGSGGGATHSALLIRHALNVTDGLDVDDLAAVEEANGNVGDHVQSHVLAMRDALASVSTISGLVREAHAQAFPSADAIIGERTNLTVARGPTGLGEGVIALAGALDVTLSASDELAVRQEAAVVSSDVAKAGALLAFAAVDAAHYLETAFADLDVEAWRTYHGNESLAHFLYRRAEVGAEGSNATVSFDPDTEHVLEAVQRIVSSVNQEALYQAVDVLGQAIDEVASLSMPTSFVGAERRTECSEGTLVYAPPAGIQELSCLVLIGDTNDNKYFETQLSFNFPLHEKPVITLDLGGNETYLNRAGGGFGDPDAGDGCPRCAVGLQVNVDLGDGADKYDRMSSGTVRGPNQGAGELGVGALYDGGGDDTYEVRHRLGRDAFHGQGAGVAGAGLLVDTGGNDTYTIFQTGRGLGRGQGAGVVGGFGMFQDQAGEDVYQFTLGDGRDGGGVQGFGASGGVGYLLDRGLEEDSYRTSQSLGQGSASGSGLGYLHDAGGTNLFELQPRVGCPRMQGDSCAVSLEPIAGWGQGYAEFSGFGALVVDGDGSSLGVPGSSTTGDDGEVLGRLVLGGGFWDGAGAVVAPGGSHGYEAYGNATGFGWLGMGVFVDGGGDDNYSCAEDSCYGMADRGLGFFVESAGDSDSFAGVPPPATVWVRGDLGIGANPS